MRIKEEFNLSRLFDYGFVAPGDEVDEDDYELSTCDLYYEIRDTTRNKYYLIVFGRNIHIYNSYNSGFSAKCPDVLIKLIQDGVLEEG